MTRGYIHVTNPAGQGPAGIQGPTGPAGASGFIPKYGAFQYTGSQLITNTANEYIMPWNTTDYSNDVTISNSTHIVFPTAGTYNIQWSGQFQNANANPQDAYIWLKINGTPVTGSTGIVSIPQYHAGFNGHTIAGWNYFLTFTANQYLELAWGASSTDVSLQSYAAGTNPTRPTTAALILTAQQVA